MDDQYGQSGPLEVETCRIARLTEAPPVTRILVSGVSLKPMVSACSLFAISWPSTRARTSVSLLANLPEFQMMNFLVAFQRRNSSPCNGFIGFVEPKIPLQTIGYNLRMVKVHSCAKYKSEKTERNIQRHHRPRLP